MNALQNDSGPDYSLVAPILDESIDELGEEDRTAILLRLFEQHDFRSVGQALGGTIANDGRQPTHPSQLLPYLTTPEQQAALQ